MIVHSKEAPVITIDHDVDAIYLCFKRNTKVSKTIERESTHAIVNVDLDEKGEVIGIELIGVGQIEIGQILKRAGVKAPDLNWEKAAIAA